MIVKLADVLFVIPGVYYMKEKSMIESMIFEKQRVHRQSKHTLPFFMFSTAKYSVYSVDIGATTVRETTGKCVMVRKYGSIYILMVTVKVLI